MESRFKKYDMIVKEGLFLGREELAGGDGLKGEGNGG
jgi:hypothetical protein